MKKLLLVAAMLSVLTGCATGYGPMTGKGGGYTDKQLDEKVRVATFVGNDKTNADNASLYSQFRAVEVCHENGMSLTRFYGTQNRSSSQTVQRASNQTYQSPMFVSGSGYGNSFSGTVSGGNQYSRSKAWNEVHVYPVFDTFFSCTNQAYLLKVGIKSVKAEDMKPYVKDMMGAMQVNQFMDGSPNRDVLKLGDIILTVNGNRVQDIAQLTSEVDSADNKDAISLEVIRDGTRLNVKAKAIDGSSYVANEERKVVHATCPKVSKENPLCKDTERTTASLK